MLAAARVGSPAPSAYTSPMTTTEPLAARRRAAQDALERIRRLRREADLPDVDAARLIAEVRAVQETQGTEDEPLASG